MDEENLGSLVEALSESTLKFPPGHPLRNRLLLALARMGTTQTGNTVAQNALNQLISESRDSGMLRAARQITERPKYIGKPRD
jgi:hypothetical protein